MDDLKHIFDVGIMWTTIATLFGWLPHIAALLAVIWWVLRIYEMKTVQDWLKRDKNETR